MIYPQIPLAQSIIQICVAKGIKHIVISPGSRNAPLTIGFANNPEFHCYSIADERCAAFFALGIAQQIQVPVALVCTSGSALLNYYPAFAEAFYSQIPIIVISADRPADKIDIGDGQTIRQKNVFENHSLFNANLSEEASEQNDNLINEAINVAYLKKGPVHINVPFEEPLYQTTDHLSVDPIISAVHRFYKNVSVDDIIALTNVWNSATRKLVLVGGNEPEELDADVIEFLAKDPSVVVMTEVTSNVSNASFIHNIDAVITPFTASDFNRLRPELLITFGGMIVSKRIKSFLRTYKPDYHWHIDPLRAYNTYNLETHHFECNPSDFFQRIIPYTNDVESDYVEKIGSYVQVRKDKHAKFIKSAPFSDFTAIRIIIESLPNNIMFQISNSAPIRYAQLFEVDSSIAVYCNRGTSGIDGATSTAIGAATASDRQTVFLTGDIGFLYDSNALWNNYIPKNLKIILINNGGGGIFRILPGREENKIFNTYFETEHCLTTEHLAKMYRFKYLIASNSDSLERSLEELYSNDDQPCLLEIFTPTRLNDKVLDDYFAALG